jgi:hypothetical protein
MTTTDLTISSASLPDRMQFAKALAASNLVPDAFRGQPANILLATEYGNALGIGPAVALSEINVIKGTPTLSAAMMAGLARDAGHRVRVSGDAESATCTIIRADDPDFEHTATWTKKKAQDAGLWGRGHWAKDPGTMLRWRAISECVRFACSEVLGGLKYTPDEVASFSGGAPSAPQPQPEPVAEDADVVDAEVIVEPERTAEPGITQAQQRALHASLGEQGITDREVALNTISAFIGRELDSTKNLTKVEASSVIDALKEGADEAPAAEPPGWGRDS